MISHATQLKRCTIKNEALQVQINFPNFLTSERNNQTKWLDTYAAFTYFITAYFIRRFPIFRSVHRVVEDRLANDDVCNGRSGTRRSSGYHIALLPSSAGAGANQPSRAYYYALQVTGNISNITFHQV